MLCRIQNENVINNNKQMFEYIYRMSYGWYVLHIANILQFSQYVSSSF